MNLAEAVNEVEAAGVAFRLDGDKVKLWYPDDVGRDQLADYIAVLRQHRTQVAELLKARNSIPKMPNGVNLVRWRLKSPPVLVEVSAIVTDPAKFAKTTLEQLGQALAVPNRWVGWSIPQLLDRLSQVGVVVTLESTTESR